MSQFFQDLWESIFTPGPTPTLLVATNVTFAALQVVLAGLLLATYSVHFVVLSGLCGGLWWAINWFARELKVHQAQEEEKAARAARGIPKIHITSDESETEVEGESASQGKPGQKKAAKASGASVGKEPEAAEEAGEIKKRRPAAGAGSQSGDSESQGTKSSASTEDEWEKVSENENEK